MEKVINKTTTVDGMMAVSENDMGLKYVQFLPDNPVVGQVEPFAGLAKAQLLNNGIFDSLRKKSRQRGKPVFRAGWASLSFAADGYDYITFKVPSAMRYMLAKIVKNDSRKIIAYLIKEGWSK